MLKYLLLLLIIFQLNTKNIYSQVNVQDSLALVDLYNATDGANWNNNTNWLITPVRYWHGIGLQYPLLDRVKYIGLPYHNLVGYIPFSFGNLTKLYNINMGGNLLTDSLPESLGNLTNLNYFDFSNNQLTEPLPSSIVNMSALEEIFLSNNNFSGSIPEFLGNVTNLIHLDLSHNHFSKSIPDSLCNLININWLDLSYNELNGELPQNFGNVGSGNASAQIFLNNNELTGAIPNSMLNYDYLRFDIRNNNFTELPVFPVMLYETYLWLENNKFTFEDLEQNMFLDSMYYIPQDSVLAPQTLTARLDSSFTLTSTVGGSANHYQWFKNGDTLQGAIDSILYFPFVAWADSGVYTCHITNDIVTGLTLTRRPITLNVSDTITNSLKLQTSNLKLKIFPNPIISGNDFTIYSPDNYSSSVIEIYNITGELIYSQPAQINRTKINTANLGNGVFWVKVKNGNGIYAIEKLVIY